MILKAGKSRPNCRKSDNRKEIDKKIARERIKESLNLSLAQRRRKMSMFRIYHIYRFCKLKIKNFYLFFYKISLPEVLFNHIGCN